MKTIVKLIGLIVLFLSACNTGYHTAGVHDDIYFSPGNARAMAEEAHEASPTVVHVRPEENAGSAAAAPAQYNDNQYEYQDYESYAAEPAATETYFDEDGNMFITNNYFMDHNHGFAYSSRIRRFHSPWSSFGYFDPYHSNMFWYSHNPYHFGMHLHWAAMDPFFFHPGFYYSWGYRPWGWTHYGYGWGYGRPFGSFWAGHHHGYWAGHHTGFWHGMYGYNYWPGFHQQPTSYVFGSRRPSGTNTGAVTRQEGRHGTAGGTNVANTTDEILTGRYGTSGQVNETTSAAEQGVSRTGDGSKTDPAGSIDSRTSQGVTSDTPVSAGQAVTRTPGSEGQTVSDQREQYRPIRRPEDFTNPATHAQANQPPRYQRPGQVESGNAESIQTRTRTYTPPSQQQPRSNQEYRRPAPEQRPPATTRGTEARPQMRPESNQPERPQTTQPQRPVQTRPQAAPQRAPQQQPRPQAAPQRAPQRPTPQAAPQQRAPQSRPQAAPSRSPQRSTPSPAVSNPSRGSSGSSSGVRSSSPSRSSGSSGSSSGRSSGGGGRR